MNCQNMNATQCSSPIKSNPQTKIAKVTQAFLSQMSDSLHPRVVCVHVAPGRKKENKAIKKIDRLSAGRKRTAWIGLAGAQ
ncbi:Dna polymerase Zeta Catalytic Subunit [Manis pentadactyla]|nr:Dna polymerase Zeta Catalytic Subunit [Manis pentadactyla]